MPAHPQRPRLASAHYPRRCSRRSARIDSARSSFRTNSSRRSASKNEPPLLTFRAWPVLSICKHTQSHTMLPLRHNATRSDTPHVYSTVCIRACIPPFDAAPLYLYCVCSVYLCTLRLLSAAPAHVCAAVSSNADQGVSTVHEPVINGSRRGTVADKLQCALMMSHSGLRAPIL